MKILYIAGASRSGSTLLARLLGEIEGFISVGEAARSLLDERFLAQNLPCGCGKNLTQCPFWKDVLPIVPEPVQALTTKYMRMRYYPLLALPFKVKRFYEAIVEIGFTLSRLYDTIAEKAGCDVIVDSSKTLDFVYSLVQVSGVELYVVHLVRDPRGVVSSWRNQKGYLRLRSPLKVVIEWLLQNLLAEMIRGRIRYLRVRYEDFVQGPKATLRRIVRFLDQGNASLDFLEGREAVIECQHLLAGNPDKQVQGRISIYPRPWSLPWPLKLMVYLSCFPLYLKYYILDKVIDNGS